MGVIMAQRKPTKTTKATKQSSKRDHGGNPPRPLLEEAEAAPGTAPAATGTMSRRDYERELARLQIELVKLQEWIKHAGLKVVAPFEGMLLRSGIILVKYWFSVSDEEQERRFQRRLDDPTRRWKLSPMDVRSRERWLDYSRAKDEMFAHTDTKESPWWVVDADVKRAARLNCISHLLSLVPYRDLTPEPIQLPPRRDHGKYVRPPITDQTFVPARYPA